MDLLDFALESNVGYLIKQYNHLNAQILIIINILKHEQQSYRARGFYSRYCQSAY